MTTTGTDTFSLDSAVQALMGGATVAAVLRKQVCNDGIVVLGLLSFLLTLMAGFVLTVVERSPLYLTLAALGFVAFLGCIHGSLRDPTEEEVVARRVALLAATKTLAAQVRAASRL